MHVHMKKTILFPIETARVATLLPCLVLLSASVFFSGCEADSTGVYFNQDQGETPPAEQDDPSQPTNQFGPIGSWQLSDADGSIWFIHFADNGTWKITNDAAGNEHRVHGSFKIKGTGFIGDMINPGTGTGEIKGSWQSNTMKLDFIEHWHTPYKTIHYKGSRL